MRPMILLTPGPCMTSESVRQAAAMPDMNHREPAYRDMVQEVKERLLSVYPETRTGWQAFLIGGSGTAAVEAMVSSCIREGPALVLENGFYSERLNRLIEPHGVPAIHLRFPWTEAINSGEVARAAEETTLEEVLMTHNETTTGRLNDLSAIGAICHAHGLRLLVDAMSSFGADPIDFARIDALASSANKCLHGIPGVSFVLVRDGLAEEMKAFPRHTFYLSLPMYAGDDPPLTPPVPALAALRQALREMPPGGAAERGERYLRQMTWVRKELDGLGLVSLVPIQESSCALTSVSLPNGWRYDGWSAAHRDRGFAIYGCKGPFRETHFQVSVMGEVTDRNIEQWLSVCREVASPEGPRGAGFRPRNP
jgi:2-aminoethylphosphonate-pyruvate transaminase